MLPQVHEQPLDLAMHLPGLRDRDRLQLFPLDFRDRRPSADVLPGRGGNRRLHHTDNRQKVRYALAAFVMETWQIGHIVATCRREARFAFRRGNEQALVVVRPREGQRFEHPVQGDFQRNLGRFGGNRCVVRDGDFVVSRRQG